MVCYLWATVHATGLLLRNFKEVAIIWIYYVYIYIYTYSKPLFFFKFLVA